MLFHLVVVASVRVLCTCSSQYVLGAEVGVCLSSIIRFAFTLHAWSRLLISMSENVFVDEVITLCVELWWYGTVICSASMALFGISKVKAE